MIGAAWWLELLTCPCLVLGRRVALVDPPVPPETPPRQNLEDLTRDAAGVRVKSGDHRLVTPLPYPAAALSV